MKKNMTYYDEKLKALQENIARFRRLSAKLNELRNQRVVILARVRELEKIKLDEQADVDRLEKRSLTSFFYNVIGKIDERLDKEKQEAYAARVKYETAIKEIQGIDEDIYRLEEELAKVKNSEREYNETLKEKAGAIKAAGGSKAEEILRLEERSAFLENQKKELREAISAGNSAKITSTLTNNNAIPRVAPSTGPMMVLVK